MLFVMLLLYVGESRTEQSLGLWCCLSSVDAAQIHVVEMVRGLRDERHAGDTVEASRCSAMPPYDLAGNLFPEPRTTPTPHTMPPSNDPVCPRFFARAAPAVSMNLRHSWPGRSMFIAEQVPCELLSSCLPAEVHLKCERLSQ